MTEPINQQIAWGTAMEMIAAGADVVPALVRATFDPWPCTCPPGHPGVCAWCRLYNQIAPEVVVIEHFRARCGSRVIGSWSFDIEGGWCSQHSREEAIAIIDQIRSEDVPA